MAYCSGQIDRMRGASDTLRNAEQGSAFAKSHPDVFRAAIGFYPELRWDFRDNGGAHVGVDWRVGRLDAGKRLSGDGGRT